MPSLPDWRLRDCILCDIKPFVIKKPVPAIERELISLHSRAAADLQYIRKTIESSSSFTSVSGLGAILIGVSALGTAWLAGLLPSPQARLQLWVAEAVLAATLGLLATVKKARRDGRDLSHPVSRRFLFNLVPPLLAGAALTAAMAAAGNFEIMPGLWLLLYGTGVLTAGAFSIRVVPLMGLCFMGLGILTLLLSPGFHQIMMGVGFGGLHLLFGAVIARYYGG